MENIEAKMPVEKKIEFQEKISNRTENSGDLFLSKCKVKGLVQRSSSFPDDKTLHVERENFRGYSLDSRAPLAHPFINHPKIESQKYQYGWWCLTPYCLQHFLNNAKAFVFFVTLANVLQGIIVNGLLKVNVTSIERRYNLLSSESGLVISSYDIAGCLCLLPISYIGGRGHKPRWISIGVLMMGLGSFILAMPRFLAGPYEYEAMSSGVNGLVEDADSTFCQRREGNNSNISDVAEISDLCDASHTKDAYLKQMKFVFMLGQFFNGIGNTPLGVLAVTFIDESVDKRVYPIYIGIYYMGALIGPAFGFVLGGQLLTLFTNLGETPEDITPESPMWVGAWWVGFIIAGTLTVILAIPLFGYPRKLNAHGRKRKKEGVCYSPWWRYCCSKSSTKRVDHDEEEMTGKYYPKNDCALAYNPALEESELQAMISTTTQTQSTPDVGGITQDPVKSSTSTMIMDFFRDILIILSNKSFIFLSLSAAIYSTVVSGFSTFGPKFIESQLGKSAADAANLFGYVCIPAGAGGMLIGAFLMTGLKMNHKTALQMCIGVSVSGLLAHFVLVLNCDDLDLAGITVPYSAENTGSSMDDINLNMTSFCNADCFCGPNSRFNPICGSDGITYYSPCHAGCTSQNADGKIFENCSCIEASVLNIATPGKCGVSCYWQNLILFSLFVVIFTTFMCTVPGVDLSLRCFPYHQRPLAVGMQWVMIRTLGSIPGPIIFGSLIDSTCLSWGQMSCNGGKGSCLMYRNSELSSSFLLLSVVYKVAGIIALCLALAYIKRDTIETTNQPPESKIVELPMATVNSNQQSTSGLPAVA